MAGLTAFREQFLAAGSYDDEDFVDPEARAVRYAILWAQYENSVYSEIHNWAKVYKTRYALYRYIRNIYNPAYRIGEFWKTHLWGGVLNADAEDDGCLPIVTDKAIRPAIADLWKWSNWSTQKDIVTLRGSIHGDIILRVVDAPDYKKAYLEAVYPGLITELVKDPFGNVKGYTLEEKRVSPKGDRTVQYKEVAEREGNNVVYTTFLDNTPYGWDGKPSEWSMPYGFIPMVHIQHNDVGLEWGWSELHPARSKMHELDHLASLLSDQVSKSVNAKWFMTGVAATDPELAMETTETIARPQPGREEEPMLFSTDPQSKAHPMVAPIDIVGATTHINAILEDLERDYPELKYDALAISIGVSGRALRVARQPAETKVLQRRANYDNGLKRAMQMALSIGGLRGVFKGINLDTFDQGGLDFDFGEREVFATDRLEDYEEEEKFWLAAKTAKEAGLPLSIYLERAGWSDDELEALAASPEMQARLELMAGLSDAQSDETSEVGNVGTEDG